jgi:hypothetical protein
VSSVLKITATCTAVPVESIQVFMEGSSPRKIESVPKFETLRRRLVLEMELRSPRGCSVTRGTKIF